MVDVEKRIKLHEAWARRLGRVIAHQHGIDKDDAESDALVALFEIARTFKQGPASFKTLATKRIRSRVWDYYKRRCSWASRREHVKSVDALDVLKFEKLVDNSLEKKREEVEVRDSVSHVLKIADPQQREALRLYYLEDMTLSQVAEKMAMGKNRIMPLIREGIDRIRKRCEQ